TPPPVFRASTHLIVSTVTVKDKSGRPIEGLTAEDFSVTEDGKPQQIAFVEYEALTGPGAPAVPASAPAAALGVPEVTGVPVPAPLPGDTRYRGRRLIVLYFDLLNMPFFDQLRTFGAADKY